MPFPRTSHHSFFWDAYRINDVVIFRFMEHKVDHFEHILKVVFGVWIVGSINVIFLKTTIVQWLSSISYLLAKPVKTG